jgi:hypothetical protein
MQIIERTSNWILYKDLDGYYLDTRCHYGIVEETATFQLSADEVEIYLTTGNDVIHELSDNAAHNKAWYEKQRPISDAKRTAINKCH